MKYPYNQENDIIRGMQNELLFSHSKKQGMENLVKAADYLQSAIEIFEEAGLTAQADQVLTILAKIVVDEHEAKQKSHKAPAKKTDPHTHGLTSEKMIENLKHHGIVFNLSDDGKSDKLLNNDLAVDENDLEVEDPTTVEKDFEDESNADDHKSTEKLIKIIENHGHKAWLHNGKLYAAENAGAKHTELPANIKAVKEWLGY